jgi:hypothetical protein
MKQVKNAYIWGFKVLDLQSTRPSHDLGDQYAKSSVELWPARARKPIGIPGATSKPRSARFVLYMP